MSQTFSLTGAEVEAACLDHKTLLQLLEYDPATGIFTRKVSRGNTAAGSRAGYRNKDNGYEQIYINGRRYYSHRLAWFYITGSWPKDRIDHINLIKSDNRLVNLRPATDSENQGNRALQRNNTTGFRGVYRSENDTFIAGLTKHGKFHYLGSFKTAEEAHKAYKAEAIRYFGQFARFG